MSDCPVIQEAQKVLTLSSNLSLTMRRLRAKLNRCDDCDKECPEILALQAQIKSAIEELTEEWNLIP